MYNFTLNSFVCGVVHVSFTFCVIDYGINSILFQRGIYPAETFQNHQQYGLTILMSTDEKIQKFLENVLKQTQGECGVCVVG